MPRVIIPCARVAGLLARDGVRMSDEAVRLRLAGCRHWLEALLQALLTEVTLPPPVTGWRIRIVDGSSIQAPGATGTDYRLHFDFAAAEQRVCHVHVTDVHEAESLARFAFGHGDVVLADRNFARARQLLATLSAKAHVVVRYCPSYLPLDDRQAQRFDVVEALRAQPSAVRQCSFAVAVREPAGAGTAGVAVWLHAKRLSDTQYAKVVQRLRRRASRKGHHLKAATLEVNRWVMVLTSVPPTLLSAAQILELYRVRWQIELLIKRYKSLLKVGALRAASGGAVAQVWLLGKLLYALLVEHRALRQVGHGWTQLTTTRRGTWWRIWKLLAEEIKMIIVGTTSWDEEGWRLALAVLGERRRRRKLQRLPRNITRRLCTAPPPSVLQTT